jgi:hypothetical protein
MNQLKPQQARIRIYVPLLGSPSELREALAVPFGEGGFRVVSRPAPGDNWQFKPGEIVECSSQTLADGTNGLVAVFSSSSDPEFRKRRVIYAVCGAVFGAFIGAWLASEVLTGMTALIIGAVVGGCVCSILSVAWKDGAWRTWGRWDWRDWWPPGW